MKPFAHRTENLTQSDIRAVSRMVDAVDGINLGQGICDLPTPAVIRSAAQAAIENSRSTYSSYAGIPALRAFIARWATRSFPDACGRATFESPWMRMTPGNMRQI